MKRTGLSLIIHRYTDFWVELIRRVWPSTDNHLIPGWLSYRIDNKFPYIKRDGLDYAYLLGHVAQYVPLLVIVFALLGVSG